MPVLRTPIFATQHIEEPQVDALARRRRHGIKNLAVDHVGERIAEQASLQVEIPQRPSVTVTWATLRKGAGETRDALNGIPQWSFIDEKHVVNDLIDGPVQTV